MELLTLARFSSKRRRSSGGVCDHVGKALAQDSTAWMARSGVAPWKDFKWGADVDVMGCLRSLLEIRTSLPWIIRGIAVVVTILVCPGSVWFVFLQDQSCFVFLGAPPLLFEGNTDATTDISNRWSNPLSLLQGLVPLRNSSAQLAPSERSLQVETLPRLLSGPAVAY